MTTENLKLAMTLGAKDQTGGLINKTKRDVQGLGLASQEVKKHFADMTGSFAQAAAGLIVANKMRPGINAAGELQESLIGVQTELMGTVDGADAMAKAMSDISSTAFQVQSYTPFDQAQIVNLEKELIKSGAKVAQIVGKQGAAAAAASLAAYEGMDAAETGKGLIGIATPFNVAADGFMSLSNSIAAASSASTTGAAEIVEAAKYAAGPMAALGRDTDEMFALVATLAQGGIQGSSAGTSLAAFFRQAVKVDALKDANGNLKSTTEIIETLQQKLGKLGEADRLAKLNKMFGDEGARVALNLMREGAGSYEDIVQQMAKAVPLQEKMEARMKGFNAQWESLQGTGKSTLATLFTPALDPLTQIIAKTNEWTGALGEAAQKNELLAEGASYAALAAAGGGLAYGGYQILKGGRSGMKMLSALKGAGNDAAGIAKGKAIEAATGVTPVFVTNMPDSGIAGAVGGAADLASELGKKGPKVFSKLRTTAALLGGSSLSALPSYGAGALATSAGAVTAAGAAGYGVGTLISDHLLTDQGALGTDTGQAIGEAIGEAVAYALSPFSEDARRAIEMNKMAEKMEAEVGGTINIKVDSEGRARVQSIEKKGQVDIDVYSGAMMGP